MYPVHPPALIPKPFQKLDDTPYVSPITRESETDADDPQLATNALLDLPQGRSVAETVHGLLDPEERRSTTGVGHAARTQGDVVHRSYMLDERVWEHFPRRL